MLKQLLSVFLESPCPLCNRTSDKYICQYCLAKLSSCELETKERHNWWRTTSNFAWGRYDGQLKRAIALMKYNNHPEIGIVLGELLAKAWLASNLLKLEHISIVPIPLHQHKIKLRGFNQAEKIAQGFCRLTGYKLSPQTLIRVRETKAMFELTPKERTKNLQGAFCLNRNLPKHPVLLLDDIYTMGTTVNESAKILRRNKVNVIGSIVVAKTSLK